jgi:hypothetical protein
MNRCGIAVMVGEERVSYLLRERCVRSVGVQRPGPVRNTGCAGFQSGTKRFVNATYRKVQYWFHKMDSF